METRVRFRLLGVLVAGGVSFGVSQGCFNDYDQFDLSGGERGGSGGGPAGGQSGGSAAGTAGARASGGSAGVQSGGSAGEAGSIGPSGGVGAAGAGAVAGGGPGGGTGGDAGGGSGGGTGGDAGTGATANAAGQAGSAGTGSGAVAGTAGAGGEAGTGNTAGVAGSSGSSGCGPGLKLCGTECVPNDDPQLGCAAASCDPCALPNATATCVAGACAVDTCESGYLDCDTSATNGCEHTLATANNEHCGGCNNDCTQQGDVLAGGLVCIDLRCSCTDAQQCYGDPNLTQPAVCNAGLCECGGTLCLPGEVCIRDANQTMCSCDGNNPSSCPAGTVCCQTPAGCRDLQNDSGNCGACGWQCPSGSACVAGVCQG